jgi:uncharacterized protein (TIGR02145 family)
MEDYMLGRVAIIGVVLTAVAAMFLNCSPNAKTSAATAHGAETETAAPRTPIKYVAVVETDMDAQSGASATLNPAEVRQITAVLRREAVKNLPREKYNIMTSETVQSMGGAVLEECADENCVITLGAKIGSDYIVRGVVSKFGTKFTVAVEMYETENGTLVASSDLVSSESTAELLEKAAEASAGMYKTFVNPLWVAQRQEQATLVATVAPIAPTQQTAVVVQQPAQQTNQAVAPTNQPSDVDATNTFTDSRDGNKYRTVEIGGMRWMAENLNYKTSSGSWCYGNRNPSCDKYGRLYDWKTAMTACPSGWYLPSRQEWIDLISVAYYSKKLKAISGWNNNGNGTDDYGFSALPGGYHQLGSSDFYGAGKLGYWWTATVYIGDFAYYRGMGYDDDRVYEHYGYGAYSVRCVKE